MIRHKTIITCIVVTLIVVSVILGLTCQFTVNDQPLNMPVKVKKIKIEMKMTPYIYIYKNGELIYKGIDPPTENFGKFWKLVFSRYNEEIYMKDINGENVWFDKYDQCFCQAVDALLYIWFGNGTVLDSYTAYTLSSKISSVEATSSCYLSNGTAILSIVGVWTSDINTTITEIGFVKALEGEAPGDLNPLKKYVLLLYTPVNIPVSVGDNVTVEYRLVFENVGAVTNFCSFLEVLFAPFEGTTRSVKTLDGSTKTIGWWLGSDSFCYQTEVAKFVIGTGNAPYSPNDYILANQIASNAVRVSYSSKGVDIYSSFIVEPNTPIYEVGLEVQVRSSGSYYYYILVLRKVLDTPIIVSEPTTIVIDLAIRW